MNLSSNSIGMTAQEININRGLAFRERIFKSDWTPADTEFLLLIFQLVNEALPTLQPNTDYTLEEICGYAFWSSLHKSERIKAGMYMAYMYRQGYFPLQEGKPVGVTKTYRLARV